MLDLNIKKQFVKSLVLAQCADLDRLFNCLISYTHPLALTYEKS
jgi:hypothetical protein